MKLKKRMIISVVCLLIFSMILFFIYNSVRNETIYQLYKQENILAKQASKGIENYFRKYNQSLKFLSNEQTIKSFDPVKYKSLMEAFYSSHKNDISGITRINKFGNIVYTFPENPDVIGKDVSFQKHNKWIIDNHKPVLSDVFRLVQGYRAVVYAIPVFRKGKYDGCISALIPFQKISKKYLESIQVRNSGHANMISENGIILYSKDTKLTGKKVKNVFSNYLSLLKMTEEMVEGKIGKSIYRYDNISEDKGKGKKYYATYYPVHIENTFWSIVITTPADEIFVHTHWIGYSLLFLIIMAVLLLLIYSFYISKGEVITKKERQIYTIEHEFKTIFDNAYQFIGELDADGRLKKVNQTALNFIGASEKDVLGKFIWETPWWTHSAELQDRLKAEIKSVNDGNIRQFEVTHKSKDGEINYFDFSLKPIKDNTGKIITVLAEGREITGMIENKRKLEDREEFYKTLFDASSDAIFIMDGERFIDCNHETLEMFNCSREQILGKSPVMFSPDIQPDGRNSIKIAMEKINEALQGKPQFFNWKHKKYTGEEFDTEVNLKRVHLKSRTFVQAIVRDVSERKKAKENLEQSENRFQSITENSPFGILIYQQNKWVFANPAAEKISGYSQEEFLKMDFWEIVHEDFREIVKLRGKKRQKGEKTKQFYEFKIISKNRKEKWVYLRGGTIFWKGKNAGIITIVDIDERKKNEKELAEHKEHLQEMVKERTADLEKKQKHLEQSRQALTYMMEDVNDARNELEKVNEKLKEANHEMESFSYSVSHDLRAPLRHIGGFAELLRNSDEKNLSTSGLRYLNVISNSAINMGNLIEGLLLFSRLGRKHIKKSKVNFDEQIKKAINELDVDPSSSKIEWEINEKMGCVDGDTTLLHQIWVNLISNAIKYSAKEDKPKIKINFYIDNNDQKIFYIQDNGVGFNMKYVNKLFGVFQRLHSKEEFEGIGIGLANIQKIIAKHGGKIWADAKIDEGATFYFYLSGK